MEQDFFEFLSSEIITNILLKLSVRAIAISKCVCKSWLGLLESDEFVKSHLSRSAAALAVSVPDGNSSRCPFLELEDKIDAESSHDRRYNPLTKFDFPHRVQIEGSANGLILLRDKKNQFDIVYVCNPIYHEFIELQISQGFFIERGAIYCGSYGFGASKISGQHKVVCIKSNCDCHVYTLGTGLWRRVEEARPLVDSYISGAFVNGNLHWPRLPKSGTLYSIFWFDLETECFSTFSIPPLLGDHICNLSALRDCLCLCDIVISEERFDIWLMKDYRDDKSWSKECVINYNPDFANLGYRSIFPMKVFRDGDILIVWNDRFVTCYSNKTKTTKEIGEFDEAVSF